VSAASSHVTRPSRPALPGPACSQPQPGGRIPGPASLTAPARRPDPRPGPLCSQPQPGGRIPGPAPLTTPARRPDPGARLAHSPSQEAGSKARPALLTAPARRPDPGARLAHSPSQAAGSRGPPRSQPQPGGRIPGLAVHPHLEVQVRAGGVAGSAYQRDALAPLHMVAFLHQIL